MDNLLEYFGEILIKCRNSGINTIFEFMDKGWRPKNPEDEQEALIRLIESLDKKQCEDLVKTIRYCTDLSFFKLLCALEEGDNDTSFNLEITYKKQSFSLINKDEDKELRSEFWLWLEKHGI